MIRKDLFNNIYNPDVLSCLANLSSDEVFTSPEIANKMLDMLPQELFKSKDTKFLDPACKSGIFLREIAKRLIKGLEDQIPDLQERINHIFKNQIYGIAITELTSYLSRRSTYCSKNAKSKYSVVNFDNEQGNIIFNRVEHTWVNGRCKFCGASKENYSRSNELETHAYHFIHTNNPKEIFNMKFDVIISNPPYHLNDGGAQASASPIYQLFIEAAKRLNPSYITMIIPSRWMTGGKGLDSFREQMIHDRRISILHDFADSSECFHGVEIKGGVCYFLWEKNKNGKCNIYRHDINGISYSNRYLVEENDDIFIRYHQLINVKNKVLNYFSKENFQSFENIVSSRKPYGLPSDFFGNESKFNLPKVSNTSVDNGYSILGLESLKRKWKFISKNYPIPKKTNLNKYKIFIPNSYGCGGICEGNPSPIVPIPLVALPGQLCTETFLEIGPFVSKDEADNAISYIKTKFFRMLVGIRKQTQHMPKSVFHYVPLLKFNKKWTDSELYKMFSLSEDEISFIENNIQNME